MTVTEIKKNELNNILYNGCIRYLDNIVIDVRNENISAFVLYCSSGYQNFDVAILTHQSLQRLAKKTGHELSEQEFNPCEWEYMGLHSEFFYEAVPIKDEIYELHYDGLITEEELRALFIDVIVDVFSRIKAEKRLANSVFDDDVLLGVMFSDPSVNEINIIEEVSKAVNSNNWHDKVVKNCKFLRD